MPYVDGFVIPVAKKNLSAYKRLAKQASKLWRKYGALEYVESLADDVKPGKHTSFPRSVKLKRGEIVIFSYIVYKSRAHRNSVNKKVMSDPFFKKMCNPKNMPFDGKRMFWGGFKVFLST